MTGGGKEPYTVPIHEDGGVLRASYLHDLESSIKSRTPLAGDFLNITRTDIGSTISLVATTTCQVLEFNVCSNGEPAKIAILCVVTEPGLKLYDTDIPVSITPIKTAGS